MEKFKEFVVSFSLSIIILSVMAIGYIQGAKAAEIDTKWDDFNTLQDTYRGQFWNCLGDNDMFSDEATACEIERYQSELNYLRAMKPTATLEHGTMVKDMIPYITNIMNTTTK